MSSVVLLFGVGVPTPQQHRITNDLLRKETLSHIFLLSDATPEGLPAPFCTVWKEPVSFSAMLQRISNEFPEAVVVFADEPTDADSIRELIRSIDVTRSQIAVGNSGQAAPALFRTLFRLGAGVSLQNPCSRLLAFSPKALQISAAAYPKDSVHILSKTKSLNIELTQVPLPQQDCSKPYRPSLPLYFRFLFQILKFAGSSLFCSGLELLLYSLLYTFWVKKGSFSFGGVSFSEAIGNPAMLGSFFIARFLSASLNFILNRNVVFRSHSKLGRAILSYSLLVLVIASATYLLLGFFSFLGVNSILAHPLSTLLMFFFSYTIQRKLIF